MDIKEIYSITATLDDALFIDMMLDDGEIIERVNYIYRASDPYSPLTPIITQWITDNNPEILPYVEPMPEVFIPDEISRRQFFQQLAIQELITNTEALAAVQTGAIPETINAIIYSMPAESRFSAQMLASGATVFDRNNPLSEIVRVALDWTEEQKNQFWIDAYKL